MLSRTSQIAKGSHMNLRIFTKYIFIKIKPRNIYYFLHTALQTTQFSTYYTCTYTKNTCTHIVISTAKVVNSQQVPII